MPDIRIRVGASIDSSLENVFRPLRDEAKKARAQMNAEDKAAQKATQADMLAVARNRFKEESRLNRDVFKAKAQAELNASKVALEAAKETTRRKTALELEGIRQVGAAEREQMRASFREKLEQIRAANREMLRQQRPAGGNRGDGNGGLLGYVAGRHIVSGASRDFGRALRAGTGAIGSVAEGMGIDFDLASMTRRNVERQRLATDISNSAFQPGASGPAGVRQDPEVLAKEARELGDSLKIDPTKALSGLQRFVEIAGDLQTARDTMKQLGEISRATGSDLEHVMAAGGNVAAQFGDSKTKVADTLSVMRAIAGQGKLGAVELRDMAKQMAAIAAQASGFQGDKGDTIRMLGVFAQEARQHGGAKSAAEATFGLTSFVNTFSKNARLSAFQNMGINIFDKEKKIRNPFEIIVESLQKTKGDPRRMGKLFMDARARKTTRGFENIFHDTKGTTAEKIQAVRDEFARMNVSMKEDEIRESAKRSMNTDEAKAQGFQNKLDDVARGLEAKLLPALEKLAPDILKTAEALGHLLEWAAGNPWQAASAALALSVAKAGVGEVIARSLGLSMMGQMGGGVGAMGVGAGAGGAMGLGGLLLTAGTAAIAIAALGAAADQASKLWKETHVDTSYAPGTSEDEKKRLSKMTPEQKQAEVTANLNAAALERGGHTTGRGTAFGPPTAEVQMLTDPEKLTQVNELQLRTLADILGVMRSQLSSLDEIKRSSGQAPGGADGFKPPPVLRPSGTTVDHGSAGGAAAH